MNPRNAGPRRRNGPPRLSPLPMEWMDPLSWRLPSGKALAEFALQTGFLAPLMLGAPKFKHKKAPAVPPTTPMVNQSGEEAPGRLGSFRQTR